MNLVHLLGWTLVHSVWEFVAIGVFVLIARVFFRSAQARYVMGLVAIAACLVSPFVTVAVLLPKSSPAVAKEAWVSAPIGGSKPLRAPAQRAILPTPFEAETPSPKSSIEDAFPLVVKIWAVGLGLMSLRFLGGLFAVFRMKRRSRLCTDPAITGAVEQFADRLKISRKVSVRILESLQSPSTIGFFRTVVLLPASMLSAFPADQLEGVLAHELAHVRRLDYLANLIQSVVEILFFYHPAVWWISATIRVDREHCCDDLAIEVLGDRALYARSLFVLEEMRLSCTQIAMAASGPTLANRIRRIASAPQRGSAAPTLGVTVAILALGSIGLAQKEKPSLEAVSKTFTGQVLTPDGKPAAGATVQCISFDRETRLERVRLEKTDNRGAYSFIANPKEVDMLCGFLPKVGFGGISPIATKGKSGTIRLKRLYDVTVQIVDQNKKPIGGLTVGPSSLSCSQDPRYGMSVFILSNLYGQFARKTDSKGIAVLSVTEGFSSFRTNDERYLIDGSVDIRNISKPITLIAKPSAEVDGVLELNGNPIPNVEIVGPRMPEAGRFVRTDDQGRFRFKAEPSVKLVVRPFLSLNLARDWCVAPLQVTPILGSVVHARLELTKGALVKGTISDPDGLPATNATVGFISRKGNDMSEGTLSNPDGTPVHDASVSFSRVKKGPANDRLNSTFVARIPAGAYGASVFRDMTMTEKPIVVAEGKTYDLDLTAPAPRAHITCRVIAANGKPAQLTDVVLTYGLDPSRKHRENLQTNYDGEVSTYLEPSEIKTAKFTASWRNQFGRAFHPDPDGRFTLRLLQTPLTSVVGIVVDGQGKPIDGAKTYMGFVGDPEYKGDGCSVTGAHFTGADGKYEIDGVTPGNLVRVQVHAPGYRSEITETFRVGNGPMTTAPILRIQPGRNLQGRLIDERGRPISGALVTADLGGWMQGWRPTTDSNGHFELFGVPKETLHLKIVKGSKEIHLDEAPAPAPVYVIKL